MAYLSWISWGLLSLAGGGFLTYSLVGPDKALYLPGQTSHGHYQIELACTACHKRAFGGAESLQQACVQCHGAELKAVQDSHPKSKFTDPRNAERVTALNARLCITCHREHRPEATRAMGVTLPDDLCFYCHQDIGRERASHRGLRFETCGSAGCHNFHDNTALYEDFLIKHLDEPETREEAVVPRRTLGEVSRALSMRPLQPLTLDDQDAPTDQAMDLEALHDWETTAHARAGVNCSDCHRGDGQAGWKVRPDHTACQRCHADEADGFLAGKHGMRLAAGLPAMQPALARRPMKSEASDRTLGCTSCHGAHAFDTRRTAVQGCLDCHADPHSRAYRQSSHFRLWEREIAGLAAEGSGVSCATCHLPREAGRQEGLDRVRVQHNQNLHLRPNEKMVRSVCMSCHGLAFSLDALADEALIARNFNGRPGRHVESLDWARQRLKQGERSAKEERG